MKNRYKMLGLTASVALTLCFNSAEATTFDAGQALKATMAQGTPSNPYTDANGGVWTFGTAPSVTNGAVTAMTRTDEDWGETIKGFTIAEGAVPTINVNTGDVAVACQRGLSNFLIAPGEIVMHPNFSGTNNTYDVIRFVVPQTNVYRILATFRDVADSNSPEPGVDVHVVLNGQQVLSSAVVSCENPAPAGSLPLYAADLQLISLALGDTIDFVVGPNGGSHGNDGTALQATITSYPLPQIKWAVATGGTATNYVQNGTHYRAHIFTATGTDTLTVRSGGAIEYLVVGGGGAGRGNGGEVNSGSGGTGGQLISGIDSVAAGEFSVTVGAGGVGAANANGGPGGDSAFGSITATGGVGGTYGNSSTGTYGGDGAGCAGKGPGDGPTNNAGGPGLTSAVSGSFVIYAGGGGGGFSNGGNAGRDGGGRGESYNQGNAEAGSANTGGGGGGVSSSGSTAGKDGGSGIVIIRYQRTFGTILLVQ